MTNIVAVDHSRVGINPEMAYNKLNEIIRAGGHRAMAALGAIRDEAVGRTDWRVAPAAMSFGVNGDIRLGWHPQGMVERIEVGLTDHARGQLLGRLGMHAKFADWLLEQHTEEHSGLLRHNLDRLAALAPQGRLLVRVVGGMGKGVLSDSYRIMDSAPMFEEFVKQSMALGMVPYGGALTQSRGTLTFISRNIHEAAPGEFIVFGAQLTNSDYGRGALELSVFILRVWCNNGAVGIDMMRKVHLGKRWNGEDAAALSNRTHELDTRTVASAVRDLIGGQKFQQEQQRILALIADGAREIDAGRVLDTMVRRGRLTRGQAKEAGDLYANTALPVEALPTAEGAWRLSNVFSLMAKSMGETDAALDMQGLAADTLAITRA